MLAVDDSYRLAEEIANAEMMRSRTVPILVQTEDIVGEQRFSATLDGTTRTIVAIDARPPVPGFEMLVGASVGPGFRARRLGRFRPVDPERVIQIGTRSPGLTGLGELP